MRIAQIAPQCEAVPPPQGAVLVLKHADTFGVFDARGDIRGGLEAFGSQYGVDGLFQDDTRVLSRFELRLGEARPDLLSASLTPDHVLLTVDLTNPDMADADGLPLAAGTVHLRRRRFLYERALFESLTLRNHGRRPLHLPLRLLYAADFADVFEARGLARAARGAALPPRLDGDHLVLGYRGLDGRERHVALRFSEPPQALDERAAQFLLELPAQGTRRLFVTAGASAAAPPADGTPHTRGLRSASRGLRRRHRPLLRVRTSHPAFDEWLRRSSADLALLTTEFDTGPYPYAGIPWFSVPFGRDALVTALETLWLDPSLARGVLGFLARQQATDESAFQDAERGKILHERRNGEMALLGEVPFARYYGGVDGTPLFVLLAGEYFRRTADLAFLRTLWPQIGEALAWIDRREAEGGGLVRYRRKAGSGLANQGWKDSDDAVFHADGRLAPPPIALIEVQAYACQGRRAASELARALGMHERAALLEAAAERLRESIERRFWLEELGTYALALDGEDRPCAVHASNAGHALYSGVIEPARARRVAALLSGPRFRSGWGIRTVAEGEARYNPMACHNGAVWPHDCALVAAGFARYGHTRLAQRVLDELFDAARATPDLRLPELHCGFRRGPAPRPVAYPAACAPQAWVCGAPFLLLQSCLGLHVDGRRQQVQVADPRLPADVAEVRIEDLEVGGARATLRFSRLHGCVEASLLHAQGPVELVLRRASHAATAGTGRGV